jgi:hypothetical protein
MLPVVVSSSCSSNVACRATLLEQELLTTTGNITGTRTAYHDRQHYWSKNYLPRQATLLEQELLTTTGNITGARTALGGQSLVGNEAVLVPVMLPVVVSSSCSSNVACRGKQFLVQ